MSTGSAANRAVDNLLARARAADVVLEPFPHLVLENALPEELVDRLIAEFPPDEVVISGSPQSPHGSNKRFDLYAHDAAAHAGVSPLWRDFLGEQCSERFLRHLGRLFGEAVRLRYPELARRFGSELETARAGMRFRDTFPERDVLLDAGLSINTPVTTVPTAVREAHLDLPTKLFSGLYYLRPPEDRDTRGGNLVLCRYRQGVRQMFSRYDVDPRCVEAWREIPYRRNVLVVFLNSIDSLHEVTPRPRTPHTRRFINLVAEVEKPLFDGASAQVARFTFRARYYLRQLFSWWRIRRAKEAAP